MACALEGALQKADRPSARADQGDAYVFPAAAEASQAHGVEEHVGAFQRRAVADAGNPGAFERWLEGDPRLLPEQIGSQHPLSVLPCPTPTFPHWGCGDSRFGSNLTGRTAVYGPVCTVAWEGWGREASPYSDCVVPSMFRRLRVRVPWTDCWGEVPSAGVSSRGGVPLAVGVGEQGRKSSLSAAVEPFRPGSGNNCWLWIRRDGPVRTILTGPVRLEGFLPWACARSRRSARSGSAPVANHALIGTNESTNLRT